ncbi:CaiB/BaiF CoA transferase family protein [Sneathiella sp. HT1-7]|uniref:CaiB/BaiF CoA transferase family protein n=1 Tax=Sneathiella sp. HT1-7 TaxID=2887192 RepID=UPI001D14581B|nr:CoA transferase [Sneathiella sp. HT1-7]MCC3305155.1 CoA transferase [Sneathiella sp. HT1-7]
MTPSKNKKDTGAGPLKGVRVIELGSTVAGPFCARLMADFGADVIKVEQPEGDAVRSMGTRRKGQSLYGASILRNKRLVSINMRQEQGRDLVRKLCIGADIVVENFRPGTLERWGLGYEDLSKENAGLVLVRISGFGQTGPYSSRSGYGVVGEAVSGLREITGDPDRPPPRVATSLTDYITGLYGAFGAMMALVERNRTGIGQVVDSALYESAFSFMEPHVPAFQQLGQVAQRAGSRLPGNTPNSIYPTGDNRFVVIAAASDPVFRRLATAIGKPELSENPLFATAVARAKNEDECDLIITEWTRSKSVEEIENELLAANVPAARIYTMEDIFVDPHFRERDMLVDVEDPKLGDVTMAGVVPKLSGTPGEIWRAGAQCGEDTYDVLGEELGLSVDQINQLERNSTVKGPEQKSADVKNKNQKQPAGVTK